LVRIVFFLRPSSPCVGQVISVPSENTGNTVLPPTAPAENEPLTTPYRNNFLFFSLGNGVPSCSNYCTNLPSIITHEVPPFISSNRFSLPSSDKLTLPLVNYRFFLSSLAMFLTHTLIILTFANADCPPPPGKRSSTPVRPEGPQSSPSCFCEFCSFALLVEPKGQLG